MEQRQWSVMWNDLSEFADCPFSNLMCESWKCHSVLRTCKVKIEISISKVHKYLVFGKYIYGQRVFSLILLTKVLSKYISLIFQVHDFKQNLRNWISDFAIRNIYHTNVCWFTIIIRNNVISRYKIKKRKTQDTFCRKYPEL